VFEGWVGLLEGCVVAFEGWVETTPSGSYCAVTSEWVYIATWEIRTDVIDKRIALEIGVQLGEVRGRDLGGKSLEESVNVWAEIGWVSLQHTFKTLSYLCVTPPPTFRVFYRHDDAVSLRTRDAPFEWRSST
jgi:hypothetical protein